MTAPRTGKLPDWEAQSLRLTLFLSAPFAGADSLWKDMVGELPESDEVRQREGLRRQIGSWRDCALEMVTTSVRIDILAAPPIVPAALPTTMGKFEERCDEFASLVGEWLQAADISCVRLAVGAVLLSASSSREESYGLLASLVPSVRYDAQNSREVLYRVNRPKKSSALKDTEINRVTTWGSIRTRQLNIIQGGTLQTTAEQSYARLECDNSTSVERTVELSKLERLGLFAELVQMVVENAMAGEIP